MRFTATINPDMTITIPDEVYKALNLRPGMLVTAEVIEVIDPKAEGDGKE